MRTRKTQALKLTAQDKTGALTGRSNNQITTPHKNSRSITGNSSATFRT
jgi:hypothetical protein